MTMIKCQTEMVDILVILYSKEVFLRDQIFKNKAWTQW